ncbi:uncharacterized protein K489DRAFT_31641 [Dissoconium aciculare CBS 342.82]|uniref:Uncharacterized protein n=1 Tax=Dissoconium aciculare CBS 342.82 TaxID=1314786 RepID=A0A6J3MJ32_9PEZI|nr:uncharacterized protein K489DRAFT_31641 [Dissoconium aciculare CBS 342.82]KAF1827918.1 hypothetical protein K489DRAFT_31641 [Dissoconium aciculare CBS 342.82]
MGNWHDRCTTGEDNDPFFFHRGLFLCSCSCPGGSPHVSDKQRERERERKESFSSTSLAAAVHGCYCRYRSHHRTSPGELLHLITTAQYNTSTRSTVPRFRAISSSSSSSSSSAFSSHHRHSLLQRPLPYRRITSSQPDGLSSTASFFPSLRIDSTYDHRHRPSLARSTYARVFNATTFIPVGCCCAIYSILSSGIDCHFHSLIYHRRRLRRAFHIRKCLQNNRHR